MRPLRAIVPALRRQPWPALAGEAVWRLWKPCRSAHYRAALRRSTAALHFRPLPLYRPDLDALGNRAARAICGVADQVCSGHFSFLGYQSAEPRFPPAWNVDFVSGFAWESLAAPELRPVVRHNGSDVKVPWELSRLQFLPVLAKAHRLTGEMRYREAARDLSADWIAHNPVGVGVNWTVAMEAALRGISLCALVSLLQPLHANEESWARDMTRSIAHHLLFTESTLEFSHLVRSNHYLGNLAGLFAMASFLEGPGIDRRRRVYQRQLEAEIIRQTNVDGGDYEASLGYHVLVLQMFLNAFLVMRAAGAEPGPRFTERLGAMFRYLAGVADEQGCVPHVGDCDDGRVELLHSDLVQMHTLPPERRNSLLVPGLLGIGDALFALRSGGDPSDGAWYGLNAANCPPAPRRRLVVFPHSGLSVGRNGAAEVIFCAVPNGIEGAGSHTHNDKLGILVRIDGKELVCDSGTFCYTRKAALRNAWRSTAAHNTIAIDGAEQNQINPHPDFLFCLGNEAAVSRIEAAGSFAAVTMTASHSGYRRLGVEHRRSLRLERFQLTVHDALEGSGEHSFDLFWHLSELWDAAAGEGCAFRITGPREVNLRVEADLPLSTSLEPCGISRSYGGATNIGQVIRVRGQGRFPCNIATTIRWYEQLGELDQTWKMQAETSDIPGEWL